MSRRANSVLGQRRTAGLTVETRQQQQTVLGSSTRATTTRSQTPSLLGGTPAAAVSAVAAAGTTDDPGASISAEIGSRGRAVIDQQANELYRSAGQSAKRAGAHLNAAGGHARAAAGRRGKRKLGTAAGAAVAAHAAALKAGAGVAVGGASGALALSEHQNHSLDEQAAMVTHRVLDKAVVSPSTKLTKAAGRGALRAGGMATRATARGSAVLGRAAAQRVASSRAVTTASRTAHVGVRQVSAGAARMTQIAVQSVVSGAKLVFAAGAALVTSPVMAIATVMLGVLAVIVTMFPWLGGVTVHEEEQAGVQGNFTPGQVGDDYPYKDRPYNELSPLRYAYGNCTDFVAWRINRDLGTTSEPWQVDWDDLTPHGGHGKDWAKSENLPGWDFTDSPKPGDIFSVPAFVGDWGSSGSNEYGHVGYVAAVYADGSMLLENYGNGAYYTFQKTTEDAKRDSEAGIVTFRSNPNSTLVVGDDMERDLHNPAPAEAKAHAMALLPHYGWDIESQGQCLVDLWTGESGWRSDAENPSSGAYGIPQSLPADKMATVGDDWRTNADTQIRWGLGYIQERYGSPCAALDFWNSNNPHWY